MVGFGSEQEGGYATLPANPAGLSRLSESLGGRFIPFGTADLGDSSFEAVQIELGTTFDRLVERRVLHELRITSPDLALGAHTVTIAFGGATADASFTLASLPTRVALQVTPGESEWQKPVDLGLEVLHSQSEIVAVDYILGNRLIGRATQGPAFALQFDPYAAGNEELYTGSLTHTLKAAALDASGVTTFSPSRSISIKPPTSGGGGVPWSYLLIGLGVVLVLGGGAGLRFYLRNRRPKPSISGTGPKNGINDWSTGAVLPENTGPLPGTLGGKDRTGPLPGTVSTPYASVTRLAVVIREGPHEYLGQEHEIKEMMHIGRNTNDNEGLRIPETYVSELHMILRQVNSTTVTIHDNQSTHGTFWGANKIRVFAEKPQSLQVGEVFWVTPDIKLELIKARNN